MSQQQFLLGARGFTDAHDHWRDADATLADLQRACGGTVPGKVAIPELLDLTQQCRTVGLRIAREFSAFDGTHTVKGFARLLPVDEGCEIMIENWRLITLEPEDPAEEQARRDAIDRAAAEITARLNAAGQLQHMAVTARDADTLQAAVDAAPGRAWHDYVTLVDPMDEVRNAKTHDGARVRLPGSQRSWRARVLPIGASSPSPRAFELLLIADEPLPLEHEHSERQNESASGRLIGSALASALQQPVTRIVSHAETIRLRLAGPLQCEYSEYASHIAEAGGHLAQMLGDLADLEIVEAPGFAPVREPVDLVEVARQAAMILGVRAGERSITIQPSAVDETVTACGEYRRVLQIAINVINNAIAYSPGGSEIMVDVEVIAGAATLTVRDQGPGLTSEEAGRVFEKFERLGREGEGESEPGSGLGLYISRRLALAMGGTLDVINPLDTDSKATRKERSYGAQFRLTLPRETS
ncbi:MAG: HAMP domain-containing sensor histidine kinase [Erythrobacter sp.]